jgi:pimeloyl-ACP methyl ester carboxylesterase
MLTRQNPHGYALAVESLKNSASSQWHYITAKTVIISGEEDKVSTVEAGKVTASEIGGHAEQICLSRVGHWHMLEAPTQCIEIIKMFAK